MTDYKQKQTTTFAMLMKVMEENEALKKELKETNEELQTALIECDRFEGENEGLRENIMGLEEILEENGLLD